MASLRAHGDQPGLARLRRQRHLPDALSNATRGPLVGGVHRQCHAVRRRRRGLFQAGAARAVQRRGGAVGRTATVAHGIQLPDSGAAVLLCRECRGHRPAVVRRAHWPRLRRRPRGRCGRQRCRDRRTVRAVPGCGACLGRYRRDRGGGRCRLGARPRTTLARHAGGSRRRRARCCSGYRRAAGALAVQVAQPDVAYRRHRGRCRAGEPPRLARRCRERCGAAQACAGSEPDGTRGAPRASRRLHRRRRYDGNHALDGRCRGARLSRGRHRRTAVPLAAHSACPGVGRRWRCRGAAGASFRCDGNRRRRAQPAAR